MEKRTLSRRDALTRTGLLLGAGLTAEKLLPTAASAQSSSQNTSRPFLFCLNTATIRGQKLGIVKEIEIAGKAG